MSEYREASDDQLDAVRALLPPPAAEVGQIVWWSNNIGTTIYQGRITEIELGYYGYKIAADSVTRQYYAASERRFDFDLYKDEAKWSDCSFAEYERETFAGEENHDWWSKFCWSFEEACEKASKEMDRWASDAQRDADQRTRRAAYLRALAGEAVAA